MVQGEEVDGGSWYQQGAPLDPRRGLEVPKKVFMPKKAHLAGIGGIGMSALAQWLRAGGWAVSGTDGVRSDVTDALVRSGIPVEIGEPSPLGGRPDLLVYSDAVPAAHALRVAARQSGIREIAYPELLGELTAPLKTVAVSGSHGKSTTTALVGLLLEAAGKDPTVVVGTRVPHWQAGNRKPETGNLVGNFRKGASSVAVVEADEYRRHFLTLQPSVAVVTSVDYDHVDAFPTEADYVAAYREFVRGTRPGGTAVLRADDPHMPTVRAAVPAHAQVVTFAVSFDPNVADVVASPPTATEDQQRFSLAVRGTDRGEHRLAVPGEHAVANAAAAIAATLSFEISPEVIRRVFRDFRGTWRRFELVGSVNGAPLISDYAHHPTELRALAAAARQRYPDRKLLIAFQPHQRARTRAFAQRFIEALAQFDEIILAEVYDVAGREPHFAGASRGLRESGRVSTRDWIEPLRASGRTVLYAPTLQDVEDAVRAQSRAGAAAFIVGAGDIDAVARRLAEPPPADP